MTSTDYAVATGGGNQITVGVTREVALRVAQRHADETGEAVSVYPVPVSLDDDGEPIDESEVVRPRDADLLSALSAYDDGTGTIGIIVRHALADDPDASVKDIRAIIVEARADAASERER